MEITAVDRAGNRTVSEAPDDEYPGRTCHRGRHGPGHRRVVDRHRLRPGPHDDGQGGGLGGRRPFMDHGGTDRAGAPGVSSERIRVAGHEVVSVYQPNYAPPFMRTVLGRTSNSLPGTHRLLFAPSTPRASPSLAPQAQTCTDTLDEKVRISGLNFAYSGTTGDTTISWNRLSTADCDGYRLGILAGRRVLLIADLSRTTSSFSIPRASELGRYIEADIGDADGDDLTILVALRHASAGSGTDNFGRRTANATVDLATLTAPTTAVTGGVVAPFLLHPASAPAVLPAIRADDTSLLCRFTTSDPPHDEVVLSFTHRPATLGRVGGRGLLPAALLPAGLQREPGPPSSATPRLERTASRRAVASSTTTTTRARRCTTRKGRSWRSTRRTAGVSRVRCGRSAAPAVRLPTRTWTGARRCSRRQRSAARRSG